MFCCIDCFADSEIRAIIKGKNQPGRCDFCKKDSQYVYNINENSEIAEYLEGIIEIYTPKDSLPADFPAKNTDLIRHILYKQWHIFASTLTDDAIYERLTKICADYYQENPELFDNPVGILQSTDDVYLTQNSILKKYSWEDFVTEIKTHNRFHNDYINKDLLAKFLCYTVKTYAKGTVFYRARLCSDNKGYATDKMGPPPAHLAVDGRVNPRGISVLYLSDNLETTFHEVRAGIYDYITVGTFKLKEDVEVINLTQLDQISPFMLDMKLQYAINIDNLKMIVKEISKPLQNGNVLDYVPTQYISDFIRSLGYQGIEYFSTRNEKTTNFAMFNAELFECVATEVYRIKDISYKTQKVS